MNLQTYILELRLKVAELMLKLLMLQSGKAMNPDRRLVLYDAARRIAHESNIDMQPRMEKLQEQYKEIKDIQLRKYIKSADTGLIVSKDDFNRWIKDMKIK